MICHGLHVKEQSPVTKMAGAVQVVAPAHGRWRGTGITCKTALVRAAWLVRRVAESLLIDDYSSIVDQRFNYNKED